MDPDQNFFFCTEQLAGGYTTIDNMPYGIYDVKI